MIMFTSFLLSIALINLAACGNGTIESKDISKTAIYRSYTVHYDQNEKKLSAYARFSAGGPLETSIALTEPSMVLVNNQKMDISDGRTKRINFTGTHYNYTLNKSSAPRSAEITWYTDDGEFIRDQIEIPSEFQIKAPVSESSLRTNGDVTIEVESAKLGDNEEWNVSLNSKGSPKEEEENKKCCYSESFQTNNIVISKELLNDIREGSAELTLTKVRTDRKSKDSSSAGASIRSEISRKVLVNVQK